MPRLGSSPVDLLGSCHASSWFFSPRIFSVVAMPRLGSSPLGRLGSS
ncbi:unnamed protein product, partial [Callosobruchus maculatus]